jgi:hypothetical protein
MKVYFIDLLVQYTHVAIVSVLIDDPNELRNYMAQRQISCFVS